MEKSEILNRNLTFDNFFNDFLLTETKEAAKPEKKVPFRPSLLYYFVHPKSSSFELPPFTSGSNHKLYIFLLHSYYNILFFVAFVSLDLYHFRVNFNCNNLLKTP